MKLVLLAVLASLAIASSLSLQAQDRKLFNDYIKNYNKVYAAEEYEMRFQNFRASLARSTAKNQASRSAQFGITKFSDLSVDEFQNKILMKNKITPTKPDPSQVYESKVEAIPASLDWRDKNAVTAVKNQEQCGSCWAFSATENVESMWILSGKGDLSNTDFAPQQIVDCDPYDSGCNGGNPYDAFDYLISVGGIESESSYPYTGEGGNCNFQKSKVSGSISSWQYATEWYSETTLQTNLIGLGPLSVCVDASAWQDYMGGIMLWEDCAFVNVLDHCVQLVGYNSTDINNPYWIVRNSWGEDWGVDGYIYLQMWEDTCGITHEATSAII